MKAFLKCLGIVIVLTIAGMILATVAPQVGFWVGLTFLVVPVVAVFKPLPRLYLEHRAFSASVAFFVGLLTTAASYGLESDAKRLADLRANDPAAYLAALEGRDEAKWRSELEELDPDRYAEEAAKIAEVEAEREAEVEAAATARAAEAEAVAAARAAAMCPALCPGCVLRAS